MLDPEAVASGVCRALVPGGRFVGEMGGEGNIAVLRAGVREELTARGYPVPAADPQWYPSVEAFNRVYSRAGFADIQAEIIPREPDLPSGVAAWVRPFRAGWMDAARVPDAEPADVGAAVGRAPALKPKRPQA